MKVIDSPAELRAAREKLHGRVGVVMTMGALHSGHEALLRAARVQSDTLIATIFVNPLQFGPSEDFERYPRTLDADLATCARNEVDIAFTPTRTSMYPHGTPSVTIDPGPLGAVLEGSVRHGHFGGVLTVVAKLLSLTAADVAFFGEKDYQQLTLIRGMVRDLDLPVEIVGVPTVREADGLALSSRNRYLDPEQRALATGLPAALRAGAARRTPESVVAAAEAELHARGISPDYVELRAPDLGEAPVAGEARLLIAARIGTTRLIDNIAVTLEVGPR